MHSNENFDFRNIKGLFGPNFQQKELNWFSKKNIIEKTLKLWSFILRLMSNKQLKTL